MNSKNVSKVAVMALTVGLCGCTVVTMDSPDGTTFRSSMPAWPWQDGKKMVSKMTQTAPDGYRASLSGLGESQETSTNTVALIGTIVESAVRGAVEGMKP